MSDILNLGAGAKDELKAAAMKPGADKEDAFALGFFAGQISAISAVKALGNSPSQEALNSVARTVALEVGLGVLKIIMHLNLEDADK